MQLWVQNQLGKDSRKARTLPHTGGRISTHLTEEGIRLVRVHIPGDLCACPGLDSLMLLLMPAWKG